MRALAHRAHAVQRGNAQRGGEVAVGAPPVSGFFQREAQLRGQRPGLR
jgi:hypothetical protein